MQIILILLRSRLVPVLRVLQHLLANSVRLRSKIILRVIVVAPILRPAELIRPVRVRVAVLVKIALHLLRGLRRADGCVPASVCSSGVSRLIPHLFSRSVRCLHPLRVASGLCSVVLVCVVLNGRLLVRTEPVFVGRAYRHALTPSCSKWECSPCC